MINGTLDVGRLDSEGILTFHFGDLESKKILQDFANHLLAKWPKLRIEFCDHT